MEGAIWASGAPGCFTELDRSFDNHLHQAAEDVYALVNLVVCCGVAYSEMRIAGTENVAWDYHYFIGYRPFDELRCAAGRYFWESVKTAAGLDHLEFIFETFVDDIPFLFVGSDVFANVIIDR